MEVTPHVILFLDILGYSDTIKCNVPPKDENYYLNEVRDLMSTLSGFIERRNRIIDDNDEHKTLRLSRFKSLIFSDNIVFFAPYEPNSLNNVSRNIDAEMLYLNLLYGITLFLFQYDKRDFFFRGGITSGLLYYDEDLHMLFGSGLIRAYELENNYAKYPRIIIDDNLKPDDLFAGLRKDYNEDIWFLDYLELGYAMLNNEIKYNELQFDINSHIGNHQSAISNALIKHKDNDHVYKKYVWLAKYHNQFCEEHKFNDFLIKL